MTPDDTVPGEIVRRDLTIVHLRTGQLARLTFTPAEILPNARDGVSFRLRGIRFPDEEIDQITLHTLCIGSAYSSQRLPEACVGRAIHALPPFDSRPFAKDTPLSVTFENTGGERQFLPAFEIEVLPYPAPPHPSEAFDAIVRQGQANLAALHAGLIAPVRDRSLAQRHPDLLDIIRLTAELETKLHGLDYHFLTWNEP